MTRMIENILFESNFIRFPTCEMKCVLERVSISLLTIEHCVHLVYVVAYLKRL